jgi:hypothetical protein
MKCPECKTNGINSFIKMLLIFNIELRCKNCGTLFTLGKGLLFLVGLAFNLIILFVIIYSFVYLSQMVAYLGSIVGILMLGALTTLFPMRVKSKVGSRRRGN